MPTEKRPPFLLAGIFLFTSAIWVLQCLHWNSILDGDSALYSLMSLDVLEGRHYLHTAGQSHGGTPLVYLRAGLFKIFGPSPFLGFLVNGVTAAVAVTIWSDFARKTAGTLAAIVMCLLGALGSSIFAQYSATDYYVLALVFGGWGLHLALRAAKTPKVTWQLLFTIGFCMGLGFYVCRFNALYWLLAVSVFHCFADGERAAHLIPGLKEFWPRRNNVKSWAVKLLTIALVTCFLLPIPAFFSDDRFFGVNAEATLKIAIKLLFAFWFIVRWRLFFSAPGKFLGLGLGLSIGLIPEIAFRIMNPGQVDRTTGLVRWHNLTELAPELGQRLGLAFSRPHPTTLGLLAAGSLCVLIVLGLTSLLVGKKLRSDEGRALKGVSFGMIPGVLAWLLIHTYMYLMVQYFYPNHFPLYLAAALSAAIARPRSIALGLAGIAVFVAANDLKYNLDQPNHRVESGVFEKLNELKVTRATGDYWSTYDMLWAAYAKPETGPEKFVFDPLHASRFPSRHDSLLSEKRIAYIFRQGDTIAADKTLYRTVSTFQLQHGYRVELLEKKD